MNKVISITIGDIDGIGIKLLIQLWKKRKIHNFFLITNANIFKNFLKKNNINIKIRIINSRNDLKLYNKNNFFIFNIKANNKIENTYLSLKYSYILNKICFCDGIITLPINKNIIQKNSFIN